MSAVSPTQYKDISIQTYYRTLPSDAKYNYMTMQHVLDNLTFNQVSKKYEVKDTPPNENGTYPLIYDFIGTVVTRKIKLTFVTLEVFIILKNLDDDDTQTSIQEEQLKHFIGLDFYKPPVEGDTKKMYAYILEEESWDPQPQVFAGVPPYTIYNKQYHDEI
jgi:hypothetical protein